MKKLLTVLTVALLFSSSVSAQGWLNKIKDKTVNKVKDKIEKKIDDTIDKETDALLDGKKPAANESTTTAEAPAAEKAPGVATTTDFKRGSVVLFEDDIKAEKVGEFPSKWDLFGGTVEVKKFDNANAIEITDNGAITPLIKEPGAYLPEEFTIEYDFYYWKEKDNIGLNDFKLILANTNSRKDYPGEGGGSTSFVMKHSVCADAEHGYEYNADRTGKFEYKFTQGWHHVALSFNKRALKVYFDGNRVVNLPNVNQPTWFCFQVPFEYHNLTFIRNIVVAKGAVELYDRNAQDMSAVEKAIKETGKFVSNNILFDTGKATLKQESMIEIMKVADYMKKNPTARFEVQGHTDNQGSDKINDPLSQQRAEAIVKALEGLGVDGFNLKAVGKGSHEPVADNNTEAGRAQNRRVVFVKK